LNSTVGERTVGPFGAFTVGTRIVGLGLRTLIVDVRTVGVRTLTVGTRAVGSLTVAPGMGPTLTTVCMLGGVPPIPLMTRPLGASVSVVSYIPLLYVSVLPLQVHDSLGTQKTFSILLQTPDPPGLNTCVVWMPFELVQLQIP
jgi:hypothetical protein